MTLTIKRKLLMVAAIAVLGLLLVWGLVAINATSQKKLEASEQVLLNAQITMLKLRRSEKDFIARRELSYVEVFQQDFAQAGRQLKTVEQLLQGSGVDTSSLTVMENYITKYADTFNQLVDIQQRIGLDSQSGLYGQLRKAVHEVEQNLSDNPELKVAMLMLRRHEKDFMLRRDVKYVTRFEEGVQSFISELEKTVAESRIGSDIASKVQTLMSRYSDDFERLVDAEKEIGLTKNDGVRGNMRSAIHAMEEQFETMQDELDSSILDELESGENKLLMGIVLVILVVATFSYWVARSIFVPIGRFKDNMVNIVETKNLSVRLNHTQNDELGQMGAAFDRMLDVLQELMKQIQDTATQVGAAAHQMSGSSVELQDLSASQNREVEQASVAVNEMNSTIQEIARNASEAAGTVTQTLDEVMSGTRAGEEARGEIQLLTEEVQAAAAAMLTLEENSKNIETVLDTIQGIAEQTNLLALNAAIEAARAGEQGRGFAVVADEVRTLAQRTQESTVTIRETIAEFQTGTHEVVGKVTRSNERAETGISLVSRSAEILGNIHNMMHQINDMNTQIATAAEEQSHAAEEINRNVNRVAEISHTLTEQSDNTSAAGKELLVMGNSLNEVVNEFRH
ncbi:HAMP domain-containing protein [Aestuariicella sp. G3-2]|uniref:methyl-accepting chemotaxis protein n=1 Tax=Pseudomaricurvus albidus TaxID=2842452 RepID=UPI001C0D6D50|nr:methyl-accepting chemotaxis protein [Aestuariicella albida]MBU3070228.1 HAMP domain-containing protein [Aestuariicella albida]